jgi:hypothetical protein
MLRLAIVSTVFVLLAGASVLLMHKGGHTDLDVPGRTTDSGKNRLGAD